VNTHKMHRNSQNCRNTIVTNQRDKQKKNARTERTLDGDQETMHDGARGEECGEQASEAPQGDGRSGRQNCQSSDVASSHESEALVTAVFIQEVISDRVVELNPKTVDSRTTQAIVGGVSNWNVSKWKSYSP
jgi:hypothetical protein